MFWLDSLRVTVTSVAIGLVLAACSAARVAPQFHEPTRGPSERYPHLCIDVIDGEPDLSNVSITLRRTWGMGGPPEYMLRLDGNLRGEYKGWAYVVSRSRTVFEVERNDLLAILDAFDQLDFLEYDHDEPVLGKPNHRWGRPTDIPAEVISLQIGERSRTFWNYGRDELFPDETDPRYHSSLADIAELIDRCTFVEQWIGTEADRARDAQERAARAREKFVRSRNK